MQWNPSEWYGVSREFLGEVRTEFNKVTWPPRKEAIAGTIGVVVIVAILTLALSGVDMLLGQFIKWILP